MEKSNEKSSDTNKCLFAEWYAAQKGIVDMQERLKRWHEARQKILAVKPKIVFQQVGEDAKASNKSKQWQLKIDWPNEWRKSGLDTVRFRIGVGWYARKKMPNLPDEDGMSYATLCYTSVKRTFWCIRPQTPLTANQNLQYHPAHLLTIPPAENTENTITTLDVAGSTPPLWIQIDAVLIRNIDAHKKQDDDDDDDDGTDQVVSLRWLPPTTTTNQSATFLSAI